MVEGNDQRNFFSAFTRHLYLNNVQIQNYGGVDELRDFLSALANMSGFHTVQSVGIVRDAETSAASALQSVQSSLTRAGLPVPEGPETPSGGNPSVNVLILPGRDRPGMLETLLCETFAGSPEDDCINSFFDCITEAGVGEIKRFDKSRAWAFLTTKPNPHHSVGFAAAKGYWGDLDQPVFSGIRDFLKSLDQNDAAG
ncbi:MAG: hypothetical protein OXG26_11805 [Caldilineaceae bacterium]|nr:hypothetical protein [Caldilineaceae bacterium]